MTEDSSGVLRLDVADADGRLTRSWIERSLLALDGGADARAIVIESKASAFCEGLDLETLETEAKGATDAGVTAFGVLLDRLDRDRRPVIAVVDRAAKGGGVGLAAVADLVIVSERATFSLPEALVGLVPAVIFPFVARRMGVVPARWLALSGESVDARRAVACGLADEVTEDSRRALDRQLRRVGRMDPQAVAVLKGLVARHFAGPSGYRAEAVDAFSTLLASPSSRARVRRLCDGLAPWDEGADD